MPWMNTVSQWMRGERLDQDIQDELEFHVEMRQQQLVESGVSPEEALRIARRQFGNRTLLKEQTRWAWGVRWLDETRQDLSFAFRSYVKSPGITVTILATLALGIGLGTAIFSVVNAILIQPLPYQDSDRLVMVWTVNEALGIDLEYQRQTADSMSPSEFLDWRRDASVFEQMLGFWAFIVDVTNDEEPERCFVYRTTPGFFDIIGVQPALGRGFVPEEEREGGPKVVVLYHDYWQRRFHGSPAAVGQDLHLAGEPHRIIGVMPRGFRFYNRQSDAIAPFPFTNQMLELPRRWRNIKVMARLKPGMTLEQAQAGADLFASHMAREHQQFNQGWGVKLVPVAADSAGTLYPAMRALLGAVGFVLLIMCTNIANLLLVKTSSRSKELAVRCAVGAGRRRLIRQLLTESFCLSAVGGLIGLGMAYVLVGFFQSQLPGRHNIAKYVVQADAISIDPGVIAMAVVTTLATGLLFGLYPALRGTRVRLNESLKDLGQRVTTGPATRRVGRALVIAEVALAVVTVVGAGLLVRSSAELYRQGPGLRTDNTLAVRVQYRAAEVWQEEVDAGLSDEEAWVRRRAAVHSRNQLLLRAISKIPGVRGVATNSDMPFDGWYWQDPFTIQGRLELSEQERPRAISEVVTANYFTQLGVLLLNGRVFDQSDTMGEPFRVVINREFARIYFADENPLGRRLKYGGPDSDRDWMTIIGVVGDVRTTGIAQGSVPIVYLSSTQWPSPRFTALVAAEPEALTLLPSIRKAVLSLVPNATVDRARTLDILVRDSIYQLHYSMMMMGGLAVLALILALVGIYGVLSTTVRDRIREIGIRMALGSTRLEILSQVICEALRTVIIGIVIGLGMAVVLARFLRTLLYGIEPIDPWTFSAGVLLMTTCAVAASGIPALRAASLNVVKALRYE